MRTRQLAGRNVPLVGQGTWDMEKTPRESIAALRRGLDLGLTHIDTAEMYGSGAVEKLVGQAIAGRRDAVFLVSKVMPQNAGRRGTISACERSLRQLGTDHLDLYLLHWRDTQPLAETLAAFDELEKAGKIRAFGVSNFDVADLEEALALAPGRIACNQVLYHLRQRHIESALLPWCARHGIAVVGYSPFGQGDFPALRSHAGKVLGTIAKKLGKTPRQVALAFLLRLEHTFAIPKAARLAHVEENAGGDLRLSAADVEALAEAFPLPPGGPLPTL